VSSLDRFARARSPGEIDKFFQPERTGNRDWAIVSRQGAPSKEFPRHRKKMAGKWVRLQIEEEQCAAGNWRNIEIISITSQSGK
jgi:hypothetical protein